MRTVIGNFQSSNIYSIFLIYPTGNVGEIKLVGWRIVMLPFPCKMKIPYLDGNASLNIKNLKNIHTFLLSNYMLIYAKRDIKKFG